jgi:hypothetical protein
MKKILFAALAALAITSCSQNEIDGIDNGTPKSKNEIGVNTIVKKSSRAAVTSNSSFTAFKLHAYIVKSNDIATSGWGNAYMDGIEYKGSQGSWATTSGTFYWPITEMQFFGYTNDVTYTAPASSNAYPTISYTLPDTPADQKDIIVAYSKDVTKPSDNTLNLTFQHILTRINFAVKLVDSSYTYTFGGTEGKGGNWNITGSAPASGYSYTFDNTVTAKDGIYDYTQNDNSLMLYPQSLTDAKIIVKYKTEKDNATFFNDSKEVSLTGEWTNGQSIRYILTLPVGAEEMSVNTTYDENWDATDNEQTPKNPAS